MSFVKNDNQQLTVLDSTFNLTEREKRMLEKSWAKTFADKVFPAIDENIFSVLYSEKASRPNTPVNVIVGALILKEALNVTDDEIVEAMAFDIRYQYALHTTSFEEQPISDRTLSRFRARVLSYETEHDVDLIHECVVKMAKEISDFMDITPDKQRMDSLMVAANIRNLSLLELFYTCVANLCKIMDGRGTKIPDEQHHYIEKDDYNKCIYHKRDMDATERTVIVMKDADILIKICDSTGDFDDTSEYQLLIRLLKERTIIDDDGKYLIKCKNNCVPEDCIYDPGNDRSVAYFRISDCEGCPYKERCQPRFLKTRVRKEVSWKSVGRAKQLQYMQTEEFSEYAKFRNGVEAIPSLLRRRYHVDKIPVHGKKRTRLFFGFKIAALDFQKLLDYTNSLDSHASNKKTA